VDDLERRFARSEQFVKELNTKLIVGICENMW